MTSNNRIVDIWNESFSLVRIILQISRMGMFTADIKNAIVDIWNWKHNTHELQKLMSFVLGRMSLRVSEMLILTRKNWILDICNIYPVYLLNTKMACRTHTYLPQLSQLIMVKLFSLCSLQPHKLYTGKWCFTSNECIS